MLLSLLLHLEPLRLESFNGGRDYSRAEVMEAATSFCIKHNLVRPSDEIIAAHYNAIKPNSLIRSVGIQ